MKNIKLVATDLDGTFLKNDRSISPENLEALNLLGEKKIIRVAATGRHMKKVRDVLDVQTQFDYVVYSSGAGVYDWKNQKNISNQNLSVTSSNKLLHYFIDHKINFHAFFAAPENHKHWYFRGNDFCEEFERYFDFNQTFAKQLEPSNLPKTELCQFLVIIRENNSRFEQMKTDIEKLCPEIRVIRASSPITKGYIWMEVFHHTVSKANGVKNICRLEKISKTETLGIGNDYNDLDLLSYTKHSYLTDNAPAEIKHMYKTAPSNENHVLAFVSNKIFTKI